MVVSKILSKPFKFTLLISSHNILDHSVAKQINAHNFSNTNLIQNMVLNSKMVTEELGH